MAEVVKVLRLISFDNPRPSLVCGDFFDSGRIEDTIALALLGIMPFFFTIIALSGGLVGAFGGGVTDLLADTTLALESTRLGAIGLVVAVAN